MAAITFEIMEMPSPGTDKDGKFGIDKLRLTNTYDADGVLTEIGDILQNSAPPLGLTCLNDAMTAPITGISFADIIINTETVKIGGYEYPAGQAVLFTMIAVAGIEPQMGWVVLDWQSVAGRSTPGKKRLKIVDALTML